MSNRDRAEFIHQAIASGDVWDCAHWKAIKNALDEAEARGRKSEREVIAREIEDARYDLPGREAEWSRHIARRIRESTVSATCLLCCGSGKVGDAACWKCSKPPCATCDSKGFPLTACTICGRLSAAANLPEEKK